MKNSISVLFVIALVFSFIVIEIDAQTREDQRNQKRPRVRQIDTSRIVRPAVDTVLTDREVTFDLKKLSLLASLSVYGKNAYRGDGVVIVEIEVEENGLIPGIAIRESNNPKLNGHAAQAIRDYAKKHKLQPAIKDGKPVKQSGILVPVVFDMSMFEKNNR